MSTRSHHVFFPNCSYLFGQKPFHLEPPPPTELQPSYPVNTNAQDDCPSSSRCDLSYLVTTSILNKLVGLPPDKPSGQAATSTPPPVKWATKPKATSTSSSSPSSPVEPQPLASAQPSYASRPSTRFRIPIQVDEDQVEALQIVLRRLGFGNLTDATDIIAQGRENGSVTPPTADGADPPMMAQDSYDFFSYLS